MSLVIPPGRNPIVAAAFKALRAADRAEKKAASKQQEPAPKRKKTAKPPRAKGGKPKPPRSQR